MSLASFSKELKLFDIESGYTLTTSILLQEEKENFGRITWSGDGKWLSVTPSLSTLSSLPIIKFKDKQLIPFKHVSIPAKVRSASFYNCTNRNIAFGNDSGEIFIWDIKEKKVSTKVETHGSKINNVDFITISTDDKYLASGSLDSNSVALHGLKTNKLMESYTVPNSEHISGLCFCASKKNYLAASSYESTICIWDIVKSDYVFKCLNAHLGACTDISFSPVNYSVLASVGLTKTLKMYDWREKKPILEGGLGEPAKCVDFLVGGDKVVAGTVNGSIIVYDLRASAIFHHFKAHEDSVLCVKSHPMKVPKTYDDVDINTPDVVEVKNKTLDISVIDILSPVPLSADRLQVNNSSKRKSFHSTPRLVLDKSDSVGPYDSFLSKVISPCVETKKVSSLSPFTRSSPVSDVHYSPALRFSRESPELSRIKEESPNTLIDEGGLGDGMNNGTVINFNLVTKEILQELKSIRNHQEESGKKLSDIQSQVESVKNDVSAVREDLENKYKSLLNEHESLKELVQNEIKQEVYAGNCQSKIEHISQRILINEVNNTFVEGYDYIAEELKLNASRLNHIYKMLDDAIHN